MLESTLATLGSFLAERFEVERNNVAFIDREQLFYYLSKNQLPISLPCVTYFCTGVEDLTDLRNPKVYSNLNFTQTTMIEHIFVPIRVLMSVAVVCSNVSEYYKLLKHYMSFKIVPRFYVQISEPEFNGQFICNINNLSDISVPAPSGQEGKDYDRGTYYISEGTFDLISYLVYKLENPEKPVVRKINADWKIGLVTVDHKLIK